MPLRLDRSGEPGRATHIDDLASGFEPRRNGRIEYGLEIGGDAFPPLARVVMRGAE